MHRTLQRTKYKNLEASDEDESKGEGNASEEDESEFRNFEASAEHESECNGGGGQRKNKKTRCGTCAEIKRVENVIYLQKGHHICMPGSSSVKYSKSQRKLVCLYKHHAIIKEVIERSGQKIGLKLIHHTKIAKEIKIVETEESYDLTVVELYVVEYKYPGYSPDEIVRRADEERQNWGKGNFSKYNPFTNNCEHFATWCVVGEDESFQVQCVTDKAVKILAIICEKISSVVRFILRMFINSLDDVVAGLTAASIAPAVLLGGIVVLYLAYCIYMHYRLRKQYKKKRTLCHSCFKSKLTDLWLKFGTYFLTSGVSCVLVFLVLPLLAPPIGIPILAASLIIATVLYFGIPRIRRLFFEPLFYCDKIEVLKVSELNPGDVISIKYRGFYQYVIVTEVQVEQETTQGKICGVYYSGRCIFSVIAEESFAIDLKKTKVLLFDCKNLKTFSRDKVVRRARQRIGEEKWRLDSNRSIHLCYWAKLKLDAYIPNTECLCSETEEMKTSTSNIQSSAYIGKREVNLMNEIQLGDVVEFHNYGPFWDIGILVSLKEMDRCRKFEICVIAQEGFFVSHARLFQRTIDLNNDRLILHRYHEAHCYGMKERVRRAHEMLDKSIKQWTQVGFVEDRICRKTLLKNA